VNLWEEWSLDAGGGPIIFVVGEIDSHVCCSGSIKIFVGNSGCL